MSKEDLAGEGQNSSPVTVDEVAREIHDWIFSPPDSWPIKGEPSITQISAIIAKHRLYSDASKIGELEQLVCDFQAASMLGTPDDPAGVTPVMVERHIAQLRADASKEYVRGLEAAAVANCEFCQRDDYPKAALYGDAWGHRDENHGAWCESNKIRALISQHSLQDLEDKNPGKVKNKMICRDCGLSGHDHDCPDCEEPCEPDCPMNEQQEPVT